MLVHDAREIAARARHVAQAQDGARAGDPAVRLDMAAGRRAQQQIERPTDREQFIEPGFEVARAGASSHCPKRSSAADPRAGPAPSSACVTAIFTPCPAANRPAPAARP